MSMHARAVLRRLPTVALAASLAGGALAPVAAQAAPIPRPHPMPVRTVQWSPNVIARTVTAGHYHELGVTARFNTPRRLQRTTFTIRFNGGLSARPATTALGTAAPGGHNVAFVVVVPAGTRVGSYLGTGRLLAREDGREVQVGSSLYVIVRAVSAPVPRPRPQPRPVAAVVRWQPANSLGVIAVQRGQTVTETVSFTSNVALTDARVAVGLNEDIRERGVRVSVISPAAPQPVAPGAAVSVIFTISAGPAAALGAYPADLHVDARTAPGAALRRLPADLDFRVRVTPVAAQIHWQPTNQLGTLTVQRGQTITATGTFTSDVALTNAEIVRDLGGAAAHGVVVTVLTPATPATIPQGAPVPVTFTIAAAPGARTATYPAALYIKASPFGGPAQALHYGLHFKIDVDAAPATTVSWNNGNGANYVSFPPIQHGQIVTETATFTTSAAVTDAVIRLSGAQRTAGLRLRLIPLNGAAPETPVSIAANTPTTVSLVVDATKAAPGIFGGDVFLHAQPANAAARQLLHYGLHFTGAVQ